MLSSDEHTANAPLPIFVIPFGNVTVLSMVQLEKELAGISVTFPDARLKDSTLVSPQNGFTDDESPSVKRPVPIVMLFKFPQLPKELTPNVVTLLGIVIEVKPVP